MPFGACGQVSLDSLRVRDREDGESQEWGWLCLCSVCRYWGLLGRREGRREGLSTLRNQTDAPRTLLGLFFLWASVHSACSDMPAACKGSCRQLQTCWLANLRVLFSAISSWCRMRAWWPFLFANLFLLCKRGRQNTVKQKSAQNPRSHGACPRQEVRPHWERVSYSKFSAD